MSHTQIAVSTILAIKGGASGAVSNNHNRKKEESDSAYIHMGGLKPCATAPPAPTTDRQRSKLELQLLGWACDHWAEPVDALEARWGDWEFEKKCIGSIFRRAAAADPQWFFAACVAWPREVVALSPYIKSISWTALGGLQEWGSVPGRMGWVEYIKAVRLSEGL